MFDLDTFINECRAASKLELTLARDRVKAIMEKELQSPLDIIASMPPCDEDEKLLYEDDDCQVWYCGFGAGTHIPPHDHQCYAFVGVYHGVELNHMYKHDSTSNRLSFESTLRVGVGDLLHISPDDIHSVESAEGERSKALHVYLGNLSKISRSLFDWQTGDKLPLNDHNFAELSSREERPTVLARNNLG